MLLAFLLSCNRYEFFNLYVSEQAEFSNDADILFVIDNSASMWQEGASLGLNFTSFIDQLTDPSSDGQTADGLGDAVDGFVNYVTKREEFIDYQLGITTTTVDYQGAGLSDGLEPGEAGLLSGDPSIIAKYDDLDVAEAFKKNLMCNTIYWDVGELTASENQDPDYECGTEPEKISPQYLDCLCGANNWATPGGSGQEEPLEAALLTLCRSVEEPPDVCYWMDEDEPSVFGTNDVGTADGFLREDSTTVVVIIGDEGDTSRRIANGSEQPSDYLDAFDAFERTIKFAAIGPSLTETNSGYDMGCNNGGATEWAAIRLKEMAEATNGFYQGLEEENDSGDCELVDFSVHLKRLGDLLNNLDTSFRLQSVPDVSSIRVYVDGNEIEPSEAENPEATVIEYGPGWSYDAARNAVSFWGDPIINPKDLDDGCCIPSYSADVKIYYRPLSGQPRELPFSYE